MFFMSPFLFTYQIYPVLNASRSSSVPNTPNQNELSEAKYIQLYARIPSSTLTSSSEMTCSSVWSEPFDEIRPFEKDAISAENEVHGNSEAAFEDSGEGASSLPEGKERGSTKGYIANDSMESSECRRLTISEEVALMKETQLLKHTLYIWNKTLTNSK